MEAAVRIYSKKEMFFAKKGYFKRWKQPSTKKITRKYIGYIIF